MGSGKLICVQKGIEVLSHLSQSLYWVACWPQEPQQPLPQLAKISNSLVRHPSQNLTNSRGEIKKITTPRPPLKKPKPKQKPSTTKADSQLVLTGVTLPAVRALTHLTFVAAVLLR